MAYERFWAQFEVVKAAAAANETQLAVHPPEAESNREIAPQCVYERDTLLVHETAYHPAARDLRFDPPVDDDGGPVKRVHVRSLTDVLPKLAGYGGKVTPNHLISVCDVNLCPADEPDPVPPDTPPVPVPAESDGGRGVYVRVLDTGLVPGYEKDFNWLAGVRGLPEVPIGAIIPPYYGHGTFIAGLIRRVAPASEVYVSNEMHWAGTMTEFVLGRELHAALVGKPRPDIISLSAGGTTHDNRPHLGLAQFLGALAKDGHTLLVAAAGNEGSRRVLSPAITAPPLGKILSDAESNPLSSKPVISVGALRWDGSGRACFSNYGPDVTVFAPGELLVNAFTKGDYEYVDPQSSSCRYCTPPLYSPCACLNTPQPRTRARFDRMARWSGTSFATPIVAGLIAAHMTRSGEENPRKAAITLLNDEGHWLNKDKKDEYVLMPSARPASLV